MNKLFGAVSLAFLAACSSDSQISLSGDTSGDGSGGTTDPTVPVNELLLDGSGSNLTMNAYSYDENTGELQLVNLPFDASNDTYTLLSGVTLGGGFAAYESNPATSDATLNYFAVFRRSDSGNSQVVAAGTGGFADLGHAGAGATRLNASITLPEDGNYTYTGEYAAVRVTEGTNNTDDVRFVTGDARLLIDFDDSSTGSVVGVVFNRNQFDVAGAASGGALPNLSLEESSIDRDSALVNEGAVSISGSTSSSGSWEAVFAGPNGEELAGIVLLTTTGTGDIQIRETGGFVAD